MKLPGISIALASQAMHPSYGSANTMRRTLMDWAKPSTPGTTCLLTTNEL